jgi:hypothetical protein
LLLEFIVFLVKAIFYTHNPNNASKSILFYLPQTPSHWLSVYLMPSVFKTIIVVTFKFYLSIYVQASSSQENQSEHPNKQIKKNTLTSSDFQRTRKEFSLFFEDAITITNNNLVKLKNLISQEQIGILKNQICPQEYSFLFARTTKYKSTIR